MGNMLGAEKVKVADEETLGLIMERENVESFPCKSFKPVKKPIENRKKKMVRFQLDNHEVVGNNESESLGKVSGVVKFRIAVTKEELVQVLNCEKGSRYSSVEELLEQMNLNSRKISHVRANGGYVCQKLEVALRSIAAEKTIDDNIMYKCA
ncbi:hypothetical protein FRX31_003882 [Thalictrum thalictroides]|uniref:Uncharacterized protein n=1 Tax=Thalictrum thalictroides TaxID=46969 RepID=A0A7J6XDM2_THATH|nr:hypothetical protein FRX31_003882 [Thalictrum thalictroides]